MQVIKSSRWCLSSALALAVLTGAASAATWHVDQTNGDDGNDGDDWAEAFETLQEAIDRSSSDDEILVAEGTYVPDERTEVGDALSVTFLVPEAVTIRGGYPAAGGDQNPYANTTTLSGDLGGGSRAYHVLTVIDTDDVDTKIDGFVITMGEADGSDTNDHDLGGGLRILGNTPNTETQVIVQRCRFVSNDGEFGGAVGVRLNHSGADALPRFINCEFTQNESTDDGGAIYNFAGDVEVSNSLFAGNISGNRGGGMFIENTCPSFPQCQGYPKSSATVYNSTFADNDADNRGGGLLVQNRSNLTITNAIFWDNTATNGSTEAQQIDMGMTDVTLDVDYTCVEGLSGISGTGNISSDPDFVGSGDYNLTEGSPAINTADPAILIDTPGYLQADSEDWDGDGYTGEPVPDVDVNKRVIGARIDMGAFEFSCYGDMVTSATFAPPPDGKIDGADLAFLLGEWGPNPGSPADLVTNATFQLPPDDDVDGADLAFMQGAWSGDDPCETGGASLNGDNPFEHEIMGPMLDELISTEDPELAEAILILLLEWLEEE